MLIRMGHNLQLNHKQIKALLQRFNIFFLPLEPRTRGFINSEKWNASENVQSFYPSTLNTSYGYKFLSSKIL